MRPLTGVVAAVSSALFDRSAVIASRPYVSGYPAFSSAVLKSGVATDRPPRRGRARVSSRGIEEQRRRRATAARRQDEPRHTREQQHVRQWVRAPYTGSTTLASPRSGTMRHSHVVIAAASANAAPSNKPSR